MKIISIKTVKHEILGSLSFFEGERDIPFSIKRVYYIYGVPKEGQRGGHAHKNLQQMLFCPYGSIEIVLDDGNNKKSIMLDSPEKGLLIGNGIWRDMIWHKNESVLCVVASAYYNEHDYIRDHKIFKKMVEEGYWDEN
ncbi:sugar 3,4-ketoisomerase [Pectinatus sottacetonis]|uniref:sugar 3,4-ketoisomerase n=1 Tax=Pectinatus sottacetonis TaxID=1002795 RepID=UPI0018C66CBF